MDTKQPTGCLSIPTELTNLKNGFTVQMGIIVQACPGTNPMYQSERAK